jgi:G6PDH family F420-dependent oxidoreductase
MLRYGYTMMCEQSGPKELVADVTRAESVGFDFAVISDHYFPWLDEMGHSPYAWTVLGAAAQATTTIDLMTYVTCPIKRYHPAVVAQKAATVALLSDERFTLGLGAGENLNEHVTGGGWPPANVRHEMLREAIEIIRALFGGEYVSYNGRYFQVDSAKLWDCPATPPAVAVAASGPQSCRLAASLGEALISVEPNADLVTQYRNEAETSGRVIGQLPICYDEDRDRAIERAHSLFRWFGGGWKVNAELPGPDAFDAASANVRPEDVAKSIPCGSDVGEAVSKIEEFVEAGFTDIALVQIGGANQEAFLEWAGEALLPALKQ